MHPIDILRQWLDEEKLKGAHNPQHAVLSTHGLNGQPHGRIVAIREIEEGRILFFTQKRTRKVKDIKANSMAAITFWFERSAGMGYNRRPFLILNGFFSHFFSVSCPFLLFHCQLQYQANKI